VFLRVNVTLGDGHNPMAGKICEGPGIHVWRREAWARQLGFGI
jgi:hypothetical protein